MKQITFFVLALFLLFSVGCGLLQPKPADWVDKGVDLVWPEPPARPRISYLRSLTGPQDFEKTDRSGKLMQWLTGEAEKGLPIVSPYGVAADGKGLVWVADLGAHAVHVFDLIKRRVDYITSVGAGSLVSPVGVAVDGERRLVYVSDSGTNRVSVFDFDRRYLGDRAPKSGFGRPGGLATDSTGKLYVVDVLKSTVEVFAPEGTYLTSFVSHAPPDKKFNLPSNVFVDRLGRVFVTDSLNFRVEVFDPQGNSLGTLGQIGDVPGSFARPRGVAVDGEGNIFVADAAFDNIQVFNLTGSLLFFFGETGTRPGQFNLPAGLFFDDSNRLYVVDTFNQRVQIFQILPESGIR